QTIFLPAGGSPTRSAIQWWQLSPSGSIQQRGRLDDPSGNIYYSYPSIAVNSHNDVVIGYSRFSTSFYAGSGYSVRAAADPLNTLRDVTVLKAGEAPYYKTINNTKNKWGDFSATIVDPANDVDIWTIQEYAAAPVAGVDRWGTWWGQFNLASIPPPPPPPPPPTGVLLQDDFNSAGIDGSKWISNNLFSGFVDTGVAISQAN